jgi:hypothetical protein
MTKLFHYECESVFAMNGPERVARGPALDIPALAELQLPGIREILLFPVIASFARVWQNRVEGMR